MILLQKLQIKDFLSHENTEISFQKNEKILLDGQSGAGKSSILDAILWCLYGISRSDNRSLVRKGAKTKAVVSIILSDGADKTTRVTRSVSCEGKHSLSIEVSENGKDYAASNISGIRELQNFIEKDLIGASYLLFVNSVAYIQGGVDTFVTQTATKRKDLLLELLGNIDLSRLYETTKMKLSSITTDKAALGGAMEAQRAYIQQTKVEILRDEEENSEAKIKAMREDLSIVTLELFKIEEDSLSAKTNIDKAKGIEREMTLRKTIIAGLINGITRLEAQGEQDNLLRQKLTELYKIVETKVGYESLMAPIRDDLAVIVKNNNRRMAMLADKPTIRDFESDISSIQSRYDLQKKSIPVCPSGDTCPYMGRQNDSLKMYEDQLTSLKSQKEVQDFAIAEWARKYDEIKPEIESETQSLLSEYNRLETEIKKCDDAKKESETIENILESPEDLWGELQQGREDLVKMNELQTQDELTLSNLKPLLKTEEEVEALKKSRASLAVYASNLEVNIKISQSKLDSIVSRKKELLEKENVIVESQKKNKELERQEGILLKLKDAFGSNGIKATVVDYMLPRLEMSVNEILSQLSDFRIRMDTKKLKADGEGSSEGLWITIINDIGEELSFENYSGGEKLKITVAISEALASLQKVGFRMFDEVFVGLDEDSTESFAHVLHKLQQKFGQVLCISHLRQIKDMFPRTIIINKHNGVSTIHE